MNNLLRPALTSVACAVSLILGCGESFDSQMKLSGYRVVGVQASAPEVKPDAEAVELTAFDYYDGAEPITYDWSLCLYSYGAADAYRCFAPSLEFDVGTGPTLKLDFSPAGLDMRGLLSALPAFPDEQGRPRDLQTGFDVFIKLTSGPDCADCARISTVKRLTLRDESAELANHNPAINSLEVIGAIDRGQKVTLKINTDVPEQYLGADGLETRSEEYLYTWYSSAGQTEPTRSFGSDQETQLKLPSEAAQLVVMVAVRDDRGGLAVVRKEIAVK